MLCICNTVDLTLAQVHESDSDKDEELEYLLPFLIETSETESDSDSDCDSFIADDMYTVYEILAYRYTDEGNLEFQVWWLDFDHIEDLTWEPEHALNHLDVYFEFCYAHDLLPLLCKADPCFLPKYA